MNEQDNLALVTFDYNTRVINRFTRMTSENKTLFIDKINNLDANGGTNIYEGLSKGLGLLTNNHTSGERIASMILLSDEQDNLYNAVFNFINFLSNTRKDKYVFSLHKNIINTFLFIII